jgi:hypothetical protein
MKRTDQERIERELRRREKQGKVAARHADGRTEGRDPADATPGAFIQNLLDRFEHDDHQIYNTHGDDGVLEVLMAMKEELPEKHWDSVLRSAIRKTKVTEKELAFNELKESLTQC